MVSEKSEEALADLTGKMREKIVLRRALRVEGEEGAILGTYVHNALSPNAGSIGAIVTLEGDNIADHEGELTEFARKLAMHTVAANPRFLSPEDVTEEDKKRESEVLMQKARDAGKPENIAEKMVMGGLRKYYQEVVLSEQEYMLAGAEEDTDNMGKKGKGKGKGKGKLQIANVVREEGKRLGVEGLHITGFVRFGVGESLED